MTQYPVYFDEYPVLKNLIEVYVERLARIFSLDAAALRAELVGAVEEAYGLGRS